MTNRLQSACQDQSASCAKLDSPFMARLMQMLADHSNSHTALIAWEDSFSGDLGPSGVSLPLRIAGGLHYLVLSGANPGLAKVYPPNVVSDETLWEAINQALSQFRPFWEEWLQNAPQTNEVRRSIALISAAHYLAAQIEMRFHLSELGASAGLNLMFDQYQLQIGTKTFGPTSDVCFTPEWTGDTPPLSTFNIASRRGVDLNPLDAHDPDVQMRLLSYLWPDQPYRSELTRTAIAMQDAIVDQGDAIAWLEDRLKTPFDGLHLIYHTIAWQYFPQDVKRRGRAMLETAGSKATPERPIAWLRMEADGDTPGAGLSLRLWPGNHTISLGRIDFHGRWMDWQAPKRLDLLW